MSADDDRQIRIIAGSLKGHTKNTVQRLSLEVTANLIEDTPVDTGWARANWIPSIGSPAFSGEDRNSNEVSAGSAKQQAGIAVLAGYSLSMGPVFVSTGVPYMSQLNDGSSTQAPAGFVQAGIRRAIKEVSS